jgi:hypothetical protein
MYAFYTKKSTVYRALFMSSDQCIELKKIVISIKMGIRKLRQKFYLR